MSYDLSFWKYKSDIKPDTQKVYTRLNNGDSVDGLEDLPKNDILKRIAREFKSWKRVDDRSWESEKGSFQLYFTNQYFRVDCYGMSGTDMNKFIDIADEFDLPLYDPQTNERFDALENQ